MIALSDGADPTAVVAELSMAIESRSLSAVITSREDEFAVRVLYDDIENDQRFWNALAGLVFAAAALGAFNLINRIVEAQRREIGIGMALGVPRRLLAIPTLRAVSVEPIDAIRTGHLDASASRTTDWTGGLRLPGSTFAQMPCAT